MINYAMDEIRFESLASCFRVFAKGWILSKKYVVSVRCNGKEIYQFSGNQKRYDICIAYHVEITEDDYGFEESFDIPSSCELIEFYYIAGGKEQRFYSLALSQTKHHQESMQNLMDSIHRSLVAEWETNHFKLPVGRLIKGFFKSVFGKSHDRVFDPSDVEQYHAWLKLQKYKRSSKFKDITMIDLKDTEYLDLDHIHTNYVCFVGKECQLYKEFYAYVSECLKYDVLYFDHDEMHDGVRSCPQFKPDASFDTLQSVNYIGHVFVAKKEILKEFDKTKIDLYAYLLKLSEKNMCFGHVSKILYADNEKNEWNSIDACELKDQPLVSIVIPTKDHIDDLDTCISSIIDKSTYQNYEIIVVNNNSEKEETFSYFKKIQSQNIRVIDLNCEFNFSYLNNYAVKNVCRGEYVLMLNNDTEVVTNDWLEKMLLYAMKDGVGSVGAFLMFPDHTIQHAGIIMGKGGVAGHAYSGVSVDIPGYGYELKVPYDVCCCTAACLMTSKKKYLEVEGLNEDLKVAFNDVDFGLKLLKAGYRNVMMPSVKLYHYESKSRGMDKSAEQLKRYYAECDYMKEHWDAYIEHDPFYNDNYSKNSDYQLQE